MEGVLRAQKIASSALRNVPDSTKQNFALCCTLMSAVAVPVLTYIALLCTVGSRLIEIPTEDKPRAAFGSWIAAGMYALTFVYCYNYKPGDPARSGDRVPLINAASQ